MSDRWMAVAMFTAMVVMAGVLGVIEERKTARRLMCVQSTYSSCVEAGAADCGTQTKGVCQ